VRADEIDKIQYGSDDTKTHRKIKHILGYQAYHDRVGRLLVSSFSPSGRRLVRLSQPQARHRPPADLIETRHDECYNFRFKPDLRLGPADAAARRQRTGDAYHIMDRSTVLIDKGYHPCCVLPGYEMYYFTILGGLSQRSLKQYFQPTHAAQLAHDPRHHGHGGQVQMTLRHPRRCAATGPA
jgi:5-deoxy-glucuronate isomerase